MSEQDTPRFGLRRIPVHRPTGEPVIYRVRDPLHEMPLNRRGFFRATAITVGSAFTAIGCGGSGDSDSGGDGEPELVCETPTTPALTEPEYADYTSNSIRAHASRINRLVFSPDGRHLASAGGAFETGNGNRDHTEAKLWSMPDGELIGNISDEFPITQLAFSADGGEMYTLARNGFNSWSVDPLAATGGVTGVSGLTWTINDGVAVKTASVQIGPADNRVIVSVWDLVTGQLLVTAPSLLDKEPFDVLLANFTSSGQMMAIAFRDGTVRLRSATGTFDDLFDLAGHDDPPVMAFSPDSSLLATAGGLTYAGREDSPDTGDTTIKIWNTATGTLLRTLTGHGNKINALDFSADGRLLASCSGSNGTTTGLPTFATPGQPTVPNAADENSVRIWDVTSGVQIAGVESLPHRIRAVAISPDGQFVAAGSQDNTIKLWRIADAALLAGLFDASALEPDKTVNYARVATPDGQPVARALPVSANLPAAAGCTCNCVAGTYAPRPGVGGGGPCGYVCVCIPVTYF